MKTMISIKERPYSLLLLTAIVVLLATAFSFRTEDIQDKTMFGLPFAVAVWIIPALLVFFWLMYMLTKRFLYSVAISWVHVLVTVSSTILIAILLYIGINPSPSVIVNHELVGKAMQILAVTFVCGQFIYLGNVFTGLFVKPRHTGLRA